MISVRSKAALKTVGLFRGPVRAPSPIATSRAFTPPAPETLTDLAEETGATPVYITNFDVDGVRRALGEARPERPEEFRAGGDLAADGGG